MADAKKPEKKREQPKTKAASSPPPLNDPKASARPQSIELSWTTIERNASERKQAMADKKQPEPAPKSPPPPPVDPKQDAELCKIQESTKPKHTEKPENF